MKALLQSSKHIGLWVTSTMVDQANVSRITVQQYQLDRFRHGGF
jgi:hypothetical protein